MLSEESRKKNKKCSFCLHFFPSMQSALFFFLPCLSLICKTCANYKSLVLQHSPLQGELSLHSWNSESGSRAGFSVLPKSIVGFSACSHSSCSFPDHTRRPAVTSPGETHEFAGNRALTGCSGARRGIGGGINEPLTRFWLSEVEELQFNLRLELVKPR